MYRMKIVIADHDGKYLNKVVDYISSVYSPRLKVSAFTKPAILEDYLHSSAETINILLTHPDFLKLTEDSYRNVELILLLSDGSIKCFSDRYQLINKYIPMEQMTSELVSRYSENIANASRLITGSKQTKLVPVYSASGGAGKSTITLGLAAKLGRMGKAVLVLSFESLNSIFPVLPGSGNHAFSHLLFSVIDNPGTLPLKVETHKSVDTLNDFEFIEPPECFYEVSELQYKEAGLLLEGLKEMGKYDIILVDMESKPDNLTLEILRHSDKIVFIVVHDVASDFKTDQFLRQISKEESFSNAGFTDKILPVLNKYDGGTKGFLEKYGLNCPFTVPVFSGLWQGENGKYRFDQGQSFANSLLGIVNALTEISDFERS